MNTISVWAIVAVVGWASACALGLALIGVLGRPTHRRSHLDGQAPRIPHPRTLEDVQAHVRAEAKVRGYIG